MKALCALCLVLVLLLSPLQLLGDETSANNENLQVTPEVLARLRQQHRDPFLAGLLSGFYWGLGHFYAREYTKGSLFVFGDLVFKGLALGLVVKLKNKYTGAGDREIRWRELDKTDKSLVLGAVAVWLGVTALSVVDAVNSAKALNVRNDPLSRLDLGLSSREGASFVSLGLKMPF